MTLLSRLRPGDGNSRRDAREYERMLSNPTHKLVTVLILKAMEFGADAICFGFRPDIFEDPEAQKARIKAEEKAVREIQEKFGIPLDDPSTQVLERSARTRGPDGETSLPFSMRIGGVLQHFDGYPMHSFGMVMNAFQRRPVAIGATRADPQPMRYIEIGYGMNRHPITSHPDGKRRFAEVDLEIREDNTFWVYIRGTREIESDVRISRTIF
jgi:hypothetical protein